MQVSAIRAAALSFLALTLGACGGNRPSGASTDGGPDASADDATSDVGTDAGAADAPDAGSIFLLAYGGGAGQVAADVGVPQPGVVGQVRTCDTPVNAGACQLTTCQLGGIASPGPGGDFGAVTVSVGATSESLTFNGGGYGIVYFPSSITLGAGGIMKFHHDATRGGAPAFDVDATIPGLAVLTSPVPPTEDAGATIDTSRDLSVTWSPIRIGQIHFRLYDDGVAVGAFVSSIACTFDGASGAGVVSSALLSSLKQMSTAASMYAGVSSDLNVTNVVNGLTILTQSYQTPPATVHDFIVSLQ
jgi:hypothetical protein